MSDEKNEIQAYVHCRMCLEERPDDLSPREWGDIEVGFTQGGIQVWCKRHDSAVAHWYQIRASWEFAKQIAGYHWDGEEPDNGEAPFEVSNDQTHDLLVEAIKYAREITSEGPLP